MSILTTTFPAHGLRQDSFEVGPALPPGPRPPVHDLVLQRAAAAPDTTAVIGQDRQLSYGALVTEAQQLAQRLSRAGTVPGSRVAVACLPSADMIVAVYAVLLAGAAYVPVDITLPADRIRLILDDAAVSTVVSDGAGTAALVRALPAGHPGTVTARTDALTVAPVVAASPRPVTPDTAYLIYTSGSTGEPKGVVVTHRQLSASTQARALIYPGRHTFLLVSPLAFDSSVAGIWGTLTTGGHLLVAGQDETRDVHGLVELVERHRATQLLCIPALYAQLLDAADRTRTALASLRSVVLAGEALPSNLVERHFAFHRGPAELVNEYGPTEATVFASYHRFEAPGPVSIGRPIPGARLYVLDDEGRSLGAGTEGELYIGGPGVAEGYFGRPENTARAFLPDPFAPHARARMFRTGDMVRWNEDGTLHFTGRRDHQVKVRGHRVELGAVEEELRRIRCVAEAVVLPDADHTRLIAFVATTQPLTEAAVRTELATRVSPVMLPATVRFLSELPRTPNGKVDRLALARTVTAGATAASSAARARVVGDTASQVVAAWTEVLGLDTVPRDTNFFDMGGHSLAMFQLQVALERHTGVQAPIVALFQHTTVKDQARLIESSRAGADGHTGASDPQTRAAAVRASRRLRARRTSGE
ncbi:non-ribosomal peptide synthetase [Streptomyces mesophilus]|uniref:non-ribosomal peptide synthetase n=1 Tax=Streptomyces mesophilus TaxID=1775132 RepID=UPI00332B6440